MPRRRGAMRAMVAAVAAAGTLAAGAGVAVGAGSNADQRQRLIDPATKYYGVYVSQAPYSMAPINRVAEETGKHPNMSLFYNAWGSSAAAGTPNIGVGAIENACHAGMLPMLTWESWSTQVTGPHGPAWAQPDFAPSVIASGRYDAYLRASAQQIKNLDCTIALRLDQEVNSYWYPWGIRTQGMTNTPADYVAMWRHIWTVFQHAGATNVIWVWSPNVQSHKHIGLPDLSASYPGDTYVDWIGVDGYVYDNPAETFHDRFQPTFDQLRAFVPNKPWIIAECGVGSGSAKPRQLHNLVAAVARRKRLVGFNYFDTNKATDAANWQLDETPEALTAFRNAIADPTYGAAVPGALPGS